MSKSSRSVGRSARKRAARRFRKDFIDVSDADGLVFYSASGEAIKIDWEADPPSDGKVLAHLRELYLQAHRHRLRLCASKLTHAGCWEYLSVHLCHAVKFRYASELRQMVAEAARQFMGRPAKTQTNQVG